MNADVDHVMGPERMPDQKFTRCPGCSTVFRVSDAQLALREGQVRCGHCRAVFDANDHRVSLDAAPPPDDFDATDELMLGRPTVTLRSADALQPAPFGDDAATRRKPADAETRAAARAERAAETTAEEPPETREATRGAMEVPPKKKHEDTELAAEKSGSTRADTEHAPETSEATRADTERASETSEAARADAEHAPETSEATRADTKRPPETAEATRTDEASNADDARTDKAIAADADNLAAQIDPPTGDAAASHLADAEAGTSEDATRDAVSLTTIRIRPVMPGRTSAAPPATP